MEKRRLLVLVLLVLAITGIPSASLGGAAYYVDSRHGKDGNRGTENAPWQSVERVNSAFLKPGDVVYFKRGERWDGILRAASGMSARPVIYGAYGRGRKPALAGAEVKGESHLQLRDLELKSDDDRYPLLIENSHHIIAANCSIIADVTSKAYAALFIKNSHHNAITRCTIERRDMTSQGDAIYLYQDADRNLIEDNDIGIATHYSLFLEGATGSHPKSTANYNIIKNNRIRNAEGAALSIVSSADHNLVEGNDIRGGKSTSFNSGSASSFQLLTRNNIVRKNTIHDNPSREGYGLQMIAYKYQDSPANQILNNYIYNNVISNIYRYPVIIGNYEPSVCQVKGNTFRNNIICGAGSSPTHPVVIERADNVTGNSFHNNLVCQGGTVRNLMIRGTPYSLQDVGNHHPGWGHNIHANPRLDGGLRPAPGSPAIDAGAFLTEVRSRSGSGITLVVEDAGWFSDGFDISTGDTIVIGASTAVIAKIDYDSNTITLRKPVSWRRGDRVSLPYYGERPDIGAFEEGSKEESKK